MKEVFQPVYLNAGTIASISRVVFATESSAREYATMVCKRGQTIEIVKLEVIDNDKQATA